MEIFSVLKLLSHVLNISRIEAYLNQQFWSMIDQCRQIEDKTT